MENKDIVIRVENASVRFNMASEKIDSLKEYAIKLVKGQLMFQEFFALRNINLTIRRGESWAFVGPNGAGKSTLLKLICRILMPFEGKVTVNGSIAPLIELGAGFDPNLTAEENIFINGCIMGHSRQFMREHFDEIVEFAELQNFLKMPIKNYSSGMRARLGFAVATMVKPDILIVDEVLAVGDAAFRKRCNARMQEMLAGGTTLLFVSHSNNDVRALCQNAVWLDHGQIRESGTADEICSEYERSTSAYVRQSSKNYGILQNGSDIRGVAMPGEESEEVTLTEDAVRHIARGFAVWLQGRSEREKLRVAVGRDSRLSGETVAAWLDDELVRSGLDVTDMGLCTTPAMFMTTVTPGYEFDGAVMITASHLPWNRNGLKFFTAKGGTESEDVAEILAYKGTRPSAVPGKLEKSSFLDTYAALLREKIISATGKERPLAGFRIVVDAGNGAGGFFASKVLEPLGADTTGSLFLDPDGRFPHHIPNPELPEAMDSIRAAVLESHADLGVIFDTDVDRAGAVLRSGEEVNRNRLIALMSAIVLREHPGTAIVTDSITSTGLAAFIAERGGVHRRFKRGYRNVINEALRLNEEGVDCQLAMETSGHGAMKENWFLDDGAYLIVKLLIELACGRDPEALLRDLKEPAESMEFRMRIKSPDPLSAGQEVIDALVEFAGEQPGWSVLPENCEGVRVALDEEHGNGWFLLRLSLHDPLLPLNIESDSPGGVKRIAQELAPFLIQQENIDASPVAYYLVG